jgi:hypothetical integral membrane protein (TIGR02206 family)
MTATVSPVSYWAAVALAAAFCVVVCVAARRRPGRWRLWVARFIGIVLVVDALSYIAAELANGTWSATTSLPLALCNVGVVVAAIACWWQVQLLVELTYFWGLAGTLQAVLTPDLNAGFPHLVFFQYLAGHLGIVLAALFLVVGMGIVPRPGSVPRVFGITLAYTAFVGLVDWLIGANYMFLARPPGEWTVLRLLGPWPWYLLSATVVALALITLLDMPFWPARRAARARAAGDSPTGSPSSATIGVERIERKQGDGAGRPHRQGMP